MGRPNTETRVMKNTPQHLNNQLRRQMEARIFYYAHHPKQIDERLAELDKEWDIERVLQTHAAGASLFGILMASRNRKWLVLPFAVAAFLMQHALQGWCPPMEVFRRIGVRTTKEINDERNALKALRGDFEQSITDKDDPVVRAKKALVTVPSF